MSGTTVYVIKSNGRLNEIADLRNSHGFGPFVWSAVCEKYLGDEYAWAGGSADKLWPMWKDPRLPRPWSAALLVTYDRAVIERERFAEIAGLLREFVTDVGLRGRACHFLTIAGLLETTKGKCIGMCFCGTSLSDNPWWEYRKGREVQYKLAGGKDHFYVGESLDSLSKEPTP